MEAHRLDGRWKAFVSLYSSRVPGLTEPLLAAYVCTFNDDVVAIDACSLDDYRRITAELDSLQKWLEDWFGHPVHFSVRNRHLHVVY